VSLLYSSCKLKERQPRLKSVPPPGISALEVTRVHPAASAHRGRALEVLELPESAFPTRAIATAGRISKLPRSRSGLPTEAGAPRPFPILGAIAADGRSRRSSSNGHINGPDDLAEGERHFALEVKGDR